MRIARAAASPGVGDQTCLDQGQARQDGGPPEQARRHRVEGVHRIGRRGAQRQAGGEIAPTDVPPIKSK